MEDYILTNPLIQLVLLALATARLSYFIAHEDGPFAFMKHLRNMAGTEYTETNIEYATNGLAEGLLCTYCNSFWIGWFVVGFYQLFPVVVVYISLVLAFSMVSILLNHLHQ